MTSVKWKQNKQKKKKKLLKKKYLNVINCVMLFKSY